MGEMYNRIVALCNKRGIKPGRVCADTGLSRGMMSDLKMGRTKELSAKNTKIIADYFGVTTDYLLTGEETKKAPDLTEKDRRDVAKLVETIMSDMEQAGDLNFDGMPMSEEARAAMASAMRIGLEEARRRNKETYTPKKYKKG